MQSTIIRTNQREAHSIVTPESDRAADLQLVHQYERLREEFSTWLGDTAPVRRHPHLDPARQSLIARQVQGQLDQVQRLADLLLAKGPDTPAPSEARRHLRASLSRAEAQWQLYRSLLSQRQDRHVGPTLQHFDAVVGDAHDQFLKLLPVDIAAGLSDDDRTSP